MNAATVYALGRLAYSGGLLFAPTQVAGAWLGPAAAGAPAQVAVRGLAARDAALAAGLLAATLTGRRRRTWLLLGAVGDLGDLAATLAAPAGELPANARPGTIALAGGSAVIGLVLAVRG
ncbi:MAG TPA: hypothetical protein VFR49_16245 [Solirubrobacteraceae bacterium]|nr:hypothetical protein [Solirubrobacteraceae bacterium]